MIQHRSVIPHNNLSNIWYIYLHEIKESSFIVEYICEDNIATCKNINLMLAMEIASQKIIKIPATKNCITTWSQNIIQHLTFLQITFWTYDSYPGTYIISDIQEKYFICNLQIFLT